MFCILYLFWPGHRCSRGFELFDGNIMGRGFNSTLDVKHEKWANIFTYVCNVVNAHLIFIYFQKIDFLKKSVFLVRCFSDCVDSPKCCSYEYSPEAKMCNLNEGCDPTSKKMGDFLFCKKIKEPWRWKDQTAWINCCYRIWTKLSIIDRAYQLTSQDIHVCPDRGSFNVLPELSQAIWHLTFMDHCCCVHLSY